MLTDFLNCKAKMKLDGSSAELRLELANGEVVNISAIDVGRDLEVGDFWYGFKYGTEDYDINIWNYGDDSHSAAIYSVRNGHTSDDSVPIGIEIEGLPEGRRMNRSDVIAQITWKVADVEDAFYRKHGRNPSEEELARCVEKVDRKALESYSIEYGWGFINEVVE